VRNHTAPCQDGQPIGITLTRDQLTAWARRDLTDAEVTKLAEVLPETTLPATIATLAWAIDQNEESSS
jgi:hypothetical protein